LVGIVLIILLVARRSGVSLMRVGIPALAGWVDAPIPELFGRQATAEDRSELKRPSFAITLATVLRRIGPRATVEDGRAVVAADRRHPADRGRGKHHRFCDGGNGHCGGNSRTGHSNSQQFTYIAARARNLGRLALLFHVNDAGFWLTKEYFGLTVGQNIKSWSIIQTVLSVTGSRRS
jgi:hypothetical protein